MRNFFNFVEQRNNSWCGQEDPWNWGMASPVAVCLGRDVGLDAELKPSGGTAANAPEIKWNILGFPERLRCPASSALIVPAWASGSRKILYWSICSSWEQSLERGLNYFDEAETKPVGSCDWLISGWTSELGRKKFWKPLGLNYMRVWSSVLIH